MKQGDLVIRKSYGGDLIFKIEHMLQYRAILKGIDYRLLADSPLADLQPMQEMRPSQQYMHSQIKARETIRTLQRYTMMQRQEHGKTPHFDLPGRVLHLDGDPTYLRKSMNIYGHLRIPAEGFYVNEGNMSQALYRLLPQVKPDILVITGHDGMLKFRKDIDFSNLQSYKNSQNFVNAVKVAREYERNRDTLIIIAGACQSHFEALLKAGANFASSPARVLIHALDPVSIATKISYTSIKDTVNIYDVINHTVSGMEGLGGIETKGSYRIGFPKLKQAAEK